MRNALSRVGTLCCTNVHEICVKKIWERVVGTNVCCDSADSFLKAPLIIKNQHFSVGCTGILVYNIGWVTNSESQSFIRDDLHSFILLLSCNLTGRIETQALIHGMTGSIPVLTGRSADGSEVEKTFSLFNIQGTCYVCVSACTRSRGYDMNALNKRERGNPTNVTITHSRTIKNPLQI